MTESLTQIQFRMLFEERMANVFMAFMAKARPACEISFIMFTFDDPVHGCVAYKTSLSKEKLDETIRYLARRWEENLPKIEVTELENRKLHLPYPERLRAWLNMIVGLLDDKSVGVALIAGKEKTTQYVSNANRQDMAKMFKEGLDPSEEN